MPPCPSLIQLSRLSSRKTSHTKNLMAVVCALKLPPAGASGGGSSIANISRFCQEQNDPGCPPDFARILPISWLHGLPPGVRWRIFHTWADISSSFLSCVFPFHSRAAGWLHTTAGCIRTPTRKKRRTGCPAITCMRRILWTTALRNASTCSAAAKSSMCGSRTSCNA